MGRIFCFLLWLMAVPVFGQSRQVLLETTEGNILIELSDLTPVHRDNFVRLVNEHFYDSLLFHRVIKDFIRVPQLYHRRGMVAMARESDDVNPDRRSSGSHFYIVWGKTISTRGLEDIQQRLDTLTNNTVKMTPEMIQAYRRIGGTPHLDGQYTVFGEVVEGLDVVGRIMKVFTDDYDRPVDDVRIIRATCRNKE